MPAKTKSGQAAAAGAKGTGGGGKRPDALQKPLRPSKELVAVVGADPLPRGEAVHKVWALPRHDRLMLRRLARAVSGRHGGQGSTIAVARRPGPSAHLG